MRSHRKIMYMTQLVRNKFVVNLNKNSNIRSKELYFDSTFFFYVSVSAAVSRVLHFFCFLMILSIVILILKENSRSGL